jgi:cobalt/nickel transport system permease protein
VPVVHLADGIVTSPSALVGLNLVGAGSVAIAARRVNLEDGRSMAWAGMLAAFLLAAQAVNVPLLPGTSAHVIGASLVTLAVGPELGIVAMTAVLVVQAFLFGDGGLTTLGVNALDMAVFPALAVEGAARCFGRSGRGLAVTAVVGTFAGSLLGATALATLLVFGAGGSAAVAYPWLIGVQGLAGLAEGVLTTFAVIELERRSPGSISRRPVLAQPAPAASRAALAWAAIGIGIVALLVPLASRAPDALERVVPRVSSE